MIDDIMRKKRELNRVIRGREMLIDIQQGGEIVQKAWGDRERDEEERDIGKGERDEMEI